MSDKLRVRAVRDAEGCALEVELLDPDLADKLATLVVTHRAKVKRGSPVHQEKVILRRGFVLRPEARRIDLGDAFEDVFAYTGKQLDIELDALLTIDDGVLFDTKIKVDVAPLCRLPSRTVRVADGASVHSPRDRFNILANLRAIPAGARAKVLWLLILGVPVVVGNMIVGLRDQFVPGSQVWFYDHRASDGESESPLFKALLGSGAAGAAIWAMMVAQLRRYMTFSATMPAGVVRRDTRWQPGAMVKGKARVPLQQATLRIVAYNREHGQYTKKEKSGKSTRTVTREFSNDAGGVVLYERLLPFVPANMPIEGFLSGDAELQRLFDALHPPYMLTSTHGLSLQFEAQLLHPEFVDHEVVLESVDIDVSGFYRD